MHDQDETSFLADVAGVLFDVDGVLRNGIHPVPGAAAVLTGLDRAGVDYCLLTNNSTHSRASLLAELASIGFEVREDRLFTAATATAVWVAQENSGRQCLILVAPDALAEFRRAGVTLAPPDAVDRAEVVVIGGAGPHFRYDRLNAAFRALLAGAELVAVHRNTSWMTESGLSLDSGPFIAALEQATGATAALVGKPAAPFFDEAIGHLGISTDRLLMVGDDLRADIMPARELGMKTALVRTGKPIPDDPPIDARSITVDSVAALDWSALARTPGKYA